MDKTIIIEILAISTGLIVITIETIIIVVLQKHMKALDKHMWKLEESTNKNLEHLNEHSHQIEEALEKICGTQPNFNLERTHQSTAAPKITPQETASPAKHI